MSSPPSPCDFDGLIGEAWGKHALDRPDVMALLEPYREVVDGRMDDFDDDTQSWRDYSGCIWGWRRPDDEGAIPFAVQDAVGELLKRPAPSPVPLAPLSAAATTPRSPASPFAFRRNTADRGGHPRPDLGISPSADGLYQWFRGDQAMNFDAWAKMIEADRTNFWHPSEGVASECSDEDTRAAVPAREDMAFRLIALLEAGLVEVVPAGWKAGDP